MEKIKYYPMLYSTPMVQAILEGRKTKTRRTKGLEIINKNPNAWKLLTLFERPDDNETAFYNRNETLFVQFTNDSKNLDIKCPYNVGDVLWVRENFYTAENFDHWKPKLLEEIGVSVYYQADLDNYDISRPLHRGKIRPNIFLPAAYSRFFLKIKSIRVERLDEITEDDAKLEGVKLMENGGYRNYHHSELQQNYLFTRKAKVSFFTLWESINGRESIALNPFVWVYEFERIEKPNDFR